MIELNALFRKYFEGHRSRYGIEVVKAASDLSSIEMRLTFLSGETYCCAEPHCHTGTDLSVLRKLASTRELDLPPNCVVHIHGVVKRGAKLEYGGLPRESEAYEYDAELSDN